MTILSELTDEINSVIRTHKVMYNSDAKRSPTVRAFLKNLNLDMREHRRAEKLALRLQERLRKELPTGFMGRILNLSEEARLKNALLTVLKQPRFQIIALMMATADERDAENEALRASIDSSDLARVVKVDTDVIAQLEDRISALEVSVDSLKATNKKLIKDNVALKGEVRVLKADAAKKDERLSAYEALSATPGFTEFLNKARISDAHKTAILALDAGVRPKL